MELIEVSFPGVGIESFTLDKVAFDVFGIEVRWYGILIMLGIIFAFGYSLFRSKQEGLSYDDVLDLGLYIVVAGVLGARLYYVFSKPGMYFVGGQTFWQMLGGIFNIRNGGLAIYGGIIAGVITILVWCHFKKKDWRRVMDMVGPGVMMAQAIGRWGNFFNGEAHGGIVAEGSPLYFLRMGLAHYDKTGTFMSKMYYYHPTFLYESLWNILGFVLINAVLYRRKKFNGQMALTYLAWYGFGRMFIEGLRTDSLYLGGGDDGIRVSQLVGFLSFVICTGLIVYMLIRVHKQKKAGEYVPVFTSVTSKAAEKKEEKKQTTDTKVEKNQDTSEEVQNDGKSD